MPYANSCRFVLPPPAKPAPSRRSTDSALRAGTWSAKIDDPYVVVSPAVSRRSLIATGRPGATEAGRASQIPSTEGTLLLRLLLGLVLRRRDDRDAARDGRPRGRAGRGDRRQAERVARGRRAAERREQRLRDDEA